MLITIKEVSIYLGVKDSWVKYKVFKREIPYIKIGRHIRFDLKAIQNWVSKNHVHGGRNE